MPDGVSDGEMSESSEDEEKLKYPCEYCDMKFAWKSKYEIHYITNHSDEKPYLCDICGETFKQKANCESHKKRNHGKITKECDICHKVFKTINGCKSHRRHHLLPPKEKRPKIKRDPQYQCTDCGKLFLRDRELQKHSVIHSENRPVFNCEYCPKSFLYPASLKDHQKKHSEMGSDLNEAKYECEICNKPFHTHGRLIKHIALHDRCCRFCGKKFKKYDNLKQHENTHTGEKPYICRHCPNVSYSGPTSLAKHYKSKHKDIKLKGARILVPKYGKSDPTQHQPEVKEPQQPQNQPQVKEPQQEPILPQIPPQLDFMNMATPSNFTENYYQMGFSSQNPLQITVTPNPSHFTNSGNYDQSKYLVL